MSDPTIEQRLRGPFDLFRLSGRVRRGEYVLLGLLLFAVKYPLDLLVARAHGYDFNPLMYLSPRVSPLATSRDPVYLLALAMVALPFVWMGVSLSTRRLRDAGMSPFWAGLFFLPFAHFAFFAALVFLPTAKPPEPSGVADGPFRRGSGPPLPEPRTPALLARLVPQSKPAAYALSLVLAAILGLVGYVVTVQVNRSFGAMFFVGMPFGIGLLVAFMTSYHSDLRMRTAIWNGIWVHIVLFLLLLAVAFEGVACIVMMFPLVAGMSALGGALGWSLARTRRGEMVVSLLLLALPGLVGVDLARGHAPVPLSVVSSVTVRAPIETVWKNVVSFPPIDEPPDPVFALVAMPVEARIEGEGPGAVRRCLFTNGLFEAFEEPITDWKAPTELSFRVHRQPASIDDYINVTRGQFRLHDNGDGTTTLDGETWYEMKLAPVSYFGAWGQLLLHKIHLRVLQHIRRISEEGSAPLAGGDKKMPGWMATSHGTCKCTMRAASSTPALP